MFQIFLSGAILRNLVVERCWATQTSSIREPGKRSHVCDRGNNKLLHHLAQERKIRDAGSTGSTPMFRLIELLVCPSIATCAFQTVLLPICSQLSVLSELLISRERLGDDVEKNLASLECTADDIVQKRGYSLELWAVRIRSTSFQSCPARLICLMLPIRRQGSRFHG
jgi:hypothetical protein